MSAAARPLFAGGHPAVTNRRLRDGALALGVAGVAGGASIAIAIAVPKPNLPLILGGIVLVLFIGWLIATPRLELTVTAVAIFLGCLNGPIKLVANAGALSSGIQNVLVLAIVIGLIFRAIAQRTPARLPPLSGWIIAWIALVLVEAFNPNTMGLLKALGGWRQQLQWVPFFWFGYLLIRTPTRFRRMFWLLGVIALLNAFASTGQTQLTPEEVASFGSGYSSRVFGKGARKYVVGGEAHVRPLGLGGDSGFSAGLGLIALPGLLALVALVRKRWERWAAIILALGSLAGVITGLGRLQVVGTAIAVVAFIAYALLAGRRVSRSILALLAVVALAAPAGFVFVSTLGSSIFARYSSIAPERVAGTSLDYKSSLLEEIPRYIAAEPLGFGLGTAGAVSGFGGKIHEVFEGHNINADTQYNFLVKELGVLGILLWAGFLIRLIVLAATHLRRVLDPEIQLLLVGLCAPLVGIFFMAFRGPVSTGVSGGLYLYLAAGICSYWFLGEGRRLVFSREASPPASLVAS